MLKFLRATWHMKELRAEIERFEASNAAIVVAEFKPKRPGHDFRYMIQKPVPSHIGPIIGDVVSNLRSSLEHVVTELTITNVGHELEGTAFPVCTTRQAWDQVSKKAGTFAPNTGRYKLRGVPYRALLLIRKNQPFRWKRYQRNALWMLDELWNIDKHRGVHLTTTAPLSASVSFEHPDSVQILRRWFMQGRPQTRPKDGQIVGRTTYSAGTLEGDVRVNVTVESKVIFQESAAGLRGPVLNALDALLDFTMTVIAALARFDKTVV
jgi:hypothetical protein